MALGVNALLSRLRMKRCSGGSMKMIDFWNPWPDLIMDR
jgi:hypothetical protein